MTHKPTTQTEIFQAAVELPASQRREFLDRACGNNQPLRREIESLLNAHDPDGSFLQSPAMAATVNHIEMNSSLDKQLGTLIGPYKIRERIGEGGFGVVYVAEQEQPVRRRVALKVIKPGMDSREVVARFEAERQALALMDHPHIAKIFDAGTTACGRPYFVMELVRGVLITDYCDAHKLPTKQRLELFIQVCHALQHAHQKGVVHRDIKPSNVLVAPHDGVPVVKVIDFGVAKALGQQLTDKSIYTRFASMIGTPLYMSPEQAEINALDVDTRSDVYSLGVLLYELLTGTTPFDRKKLASVAFEEMRRIIHEETPETPSSRVTTLAPESKAIANSRGVDSGSLAKIIRGDLDVIVMKALEKERSRRYDTASAFAEDIGRFLNQEAILAKPASTAYRFKKFAQRHRAALFTGTLIAASLLFATIASTWSAVVATRARNQAFASAAEAIEARSRAESSAQQALAAQQEETLRAEEAKQAKLAAEARQAEASATLNFLTNKLLANSDPGINFLDKKNTIFDSPQHSDPGDTRFDALSFVDTDTHADAQNPTIIELLDRASAELSDERVESSFPNQPHVQAIVLYTIASCYARLGSYHKALLHAQRATLLAEESFGLNDEKTIRAILLLARTFRETGEFDKATSEASKALEIAKAHFGENDIVTLICMRTLANALAKGGQANKNEVFSLHNDIVSRLQFVDPKSGPARQLLTDVYPEGWPHFQSKVLMSTALLNASVGLKEKAFELAEKATEIIAPADGIETPASLECQSNLAFIKWSQGNHLEAIQIVEASLASTLAIYGEGSVADEKRQTLIRLLLRHGEVDRGMQLLEQVIDHDRKYRKPDDPRALMNQLTLATARGLAKDFDGSLQLMNEVRPKFEEVFQDNGQQLFVFWNMLASLYAASGRHDSAIELRVKMAKYAHENEDVVPAIQLENQFHLAQAYYSVKRYREAISCLEASLPEFKDAYGEQDTRYIQHMVLLAECLLSVNATTSAKTWLDQARVLCDQQLGPEHPQTLINEFNYGWYFEKSGEYAKSIDCYRTIRPRWLKLYDSNPKRRVTIDWNLGFALWKGGFFEESLQAYERYYREGPSAWHRDSTEVHYCMLRGYLATKNSEQAKTIVTSLIESSKKREISNAQTSLYWLDLAAKLLLENSQAEAAIMILEESDRLRAEAISEPLDDSSESSLVGNMKTHAELIAQANLRDKLIDTYLITNRLEDAQARVLQWLESVDISDARSMHAALRVSAALIKSENAEHAKGFLLQLEKIAMKGITLDGESLLQQLAMPNDVKQFVLYSEMGNQFLELGEYASADRLCREATNGFTRLEQQGRVILPALKKYAQCILGRALLAKREYGEAETLLVESLLSAEELKAGADAYANDAAISSLAKLYEATGRPDLAKEWREKLK